MHYFLHTVKVKPERVHQHVQLYQFLECTTQYPRVHQQFTPIPKADVAKISLSGVLAAVNCCTSSSLTSGGVQPRNILTKPCLFNSTEFGGSVKLLPRLDLKYIKRSEHISYVRQYTIIRGIKCRSLLRRSSIGAKVSRTDLKIPTAYIILGLHGTIMTDAGFFIPRILSTETCSFLVSVAVSAITCPFGGSKLLTSPMLFNVARKVSPLQQQKAVTVLTVNHYN